MTGIVADKTSNTLAKATRKAAKPVAAKAVKPGKTGAGSPSGEVVLLSGGNPQIAKGYGDAPVQAYIAAMPGWKSDLGRCLDEIIVRTVPGVRKAVKWNTPFYGAGDDDLAKEGGWLLSFHCFTKYVKVTFFRGAQLDPVPAGESKHKDVRYLGIYEGQFDEDQFAAWVKQGSQLPGEKM